MVTINVNDYESEAEDVLLTVTIRPEAQPLTFPFPRDGLSDFLRESEGYGFQVTHGTEAADS